MWRKFRIAVLLLILLIVAANTWFDRLYSTDWSNPLSVAIVPANGDGSATAERYVRQLTADAFQPIETFFAEEGMEYGIALDRPVRVLLGSQVRDLPPMIEPGTGRLGIMLWSLRARYWAWRIDGPPGTEVKLFVLYHDPRQTPALQHSVGMQKGLFGIVHVFADRTMAGSNDTVIAHELLHTLGATDKYGPDNLPRLPDGYAEPDLQPLYPQSFAELMGGRIPVSARQAEIPESLDQVVIGPTTAAEIGWAQ
ncbi:hypothetical protein HNQ60_003769 [Povalibacter uvarum]|uniref:Uncharacterized protein n=1 Tax=Povalibacter uvarum TaxID=732238 RepID=A0A841HS83_9GAMM|nr:hypothetical protein [Povalibacter uvarum]MBB6094882.1 hypothetical protein [Povalibacter uvarum]